MDIKTSKVLFLTGAGFTKNFGGFLATEMWAQIFNDTRIQSQNKLRELLQSNFDFEAIYAQVVTGNKYTDEEQAAMRGAIQDSYRRLDEAIRNWRFNSDSPYPVNIYGWGDLLNRIWAGPYNTPSLFFTLNQDLFVERRWGYPSPGAPRFNQVFYDTQSQQLAEGSFVTLPTGDPETLIKSGLSAHNGIHYIKLHGSYGWKSSDGTNQLVIGTNKESLINKEPLLKGYLDLLRSVVAEGGKKVLIIGYGFHDPHINNILLKGVEDNDLKIYVLSTQSPEEFSKRVKNANFFIPGSGHSRAGGILKGLSGYFPYALRDIFPGNQEKTIYAEQIVNALKG